MICDLVIKKKHTKLLGEKKVFGKRNKTENMNKKTQTSVCVCIFRIYLLIDGRFWSRFYFDRSHFLTDFNHILPYNTVDYKEK